MWFSNSQGVKKRFLDHPNGGGTQDTNEKSIGNVTKDRASLFLSGEKEVNQEVVGKKGPRRFCRGGQGGQTEEFKNANE